MYNSLFFDEKFVLYFFFQYKHAIEKKGQEPMCIQVVNS